MRWRRAFLFLSGLPVRLCRAREADPPRTPAWPVPGWEGLAPVEALRAAAPPRDEPARREDVPVFWEEPVLWDELVGVRPPVRMRAAEPEPVPRAGVRPPGCPAEAAAVVGLRTAVVVPRKMPEERVVLLVGAGRAIPVAPPRTLPDERPAAVEPVVVVCARAAVVAPRTMPAERAEGVGAAPAARTADGR